MKTQRIRAAIVLLAVTVLTSQLPAATPAHAGYLRPTSAAAGADTFALPAPQESPTPSATPTPTPDAELEEAKRATQLAEEKKKKEEAEKDAAAARNERLKAIIQPLGEPKNVSVPTGTVQTDAAGWAESQVLAQEGARQITRRLTKFLCNNPKDVKGKQLTIDTLVIYNASDIAAIELYDSIIEQLGFLVKEFDDKHTQVEKALAKTDPTRPASEGDSQVIDFGPEAAFALPGIATSVTKSVAELLNLFRTDTNFFNQSVTINEDTVVSYIADYLSEDTSTLNEEDSLGCTSRFYIYYPLYMPARRPAKPPAGAPAETCPGDQKSIAGVVAIVTQRKNQAAADLDSLNARLKLLTDLGAAVAASKAKAKEKAAKEKALNDPKATPAQKKKLREEIKALEGELNEANANIKKLSGKGENATAQDVEAMVKNSGNFEEWKKLLTKLKTETEALIASTEQFIVKLNTPEEGTKLTALARLLRAERLKCILDTDNTYTLRVAVTANGTTKIKKNLFVDAKVRHSARAGLVYQLFDNQGRVAKGSSMQCYIDYQSARDVMNAVSGNGPPVVCSTNDGKKDGGSDQNVAVK